MSKLKKGCRICDSLISCVLYQLQYDCGSTVTAALAQLYDAGVTAVAVGIFRSDLIEKLCGKINLFGISLLSCAFRGNFLDRIKNLQHLTACVQPAGLILLDLLLDFIINGNLSSVYGLFDALAVCILAGNLCGHGDGLIIVAFFDSQSDQMLGDPADFLSLCFGGNDLSMIQKRGDLAAQERLSLIAGLLNFL